MNASTMSLDLARLHENHEQAERLREKRPRLNRPTI